MWTYRAALKKIIDADTLEVRVDLGFKVEHTIRIRLKGVDAFEKNTEQGREAILALGEMFQDEGVYDPENEWPLSISTQYDKTFDRFVADVTLQEGYGTHVSTWLLQQGWAVPYKKR